MPEYCAAFADDDEGLLVWNRNWVNSSTADTFEWNGMEAIREIRSKPRIPLKRVNMVILKKPA